MRKRKQTKDEQIKSLIAELLPLLDLNEKRELIGKLQGELYAKQVMKADS